MAWSGAIWTIRCCVDDILEGDFFMYIGFCATVRFHYKEKKERYKITLVIVTESVKIHFFFFLQNCQQIYWYRKWRILTFEERSWISTVTFTISILLPSTKCECTFAATAGLWCNAGVMGVDSSSYSGEVTASCREQRLKTDVKKSHYKKSRQHSQLLLLNRFSWRPCTVQFGCTMQSHVPMTKGQSCFKPPFGSQQ